MEASGQTYSSGRWVVKEGSEEEFVTQWTSFIDWTLANADGSGSFHLIQDVEDPRRFLSFGSWRDVEAAQAWQQHPDFGDQLGRCRALCDEFESHGYRLRSAPTR
ncbi:MAG: hypothetical protein QOK04_2689 [Solirubrobacteraceae bacterium]|jgi:heme-degrading monooxygenase HmoA|nr:hypothetical protein [Solirubrobacteraceae bacterium]